MAPPPAEIAPGRPEQLATRIAFFIAGVAIAAWAPLVPFAKTRTGLHEATLGLLLLCIGTGSIVAMPLAGTLAARFGCRRILIAASALICLALPLLATVASISVLAAALFIFGAGVGSVDCVINIQAVIVERASGRPMMSGFHGLFSVGGIVGAGGMSALLSAGASPFLAALCVVSGIVVALCKAGPHFLPSAGEGPTLAFGIPHGIVMLIGVLCFVVFLTEGSVLDWSAVFLSSTRGLNPSYAGLGYTAFAVTMTFGRLTGDAIVRRVGSVQVLALGSVCAAIGLALGMLVSDWEAGVLGFALVGAGCSNIVPVLYSAVGRQTIMPQHTAVSTITILGYTGILAGPAAIGFIARATSLPIAFLVIALLLLGVAASGRMIEVAAMSR
jgi:predicted MFS family arabinose efflux permease